MAIAKENWRVIAQKKQETRASLIREEWRLKEKYEGMNVLDVPSKCGILSQKELQITSEGDAVDLVEKLKNGVYTAEEVTLAFCKRAAIAQQLTNCLTEIFFEQALVRAKELDEERKTTPKAKLRPLHGLPISLKDSFKLPGVDSSIGLACFGLQPDDHYSALPQLLIDLGAVLYCKTNIPQTMMTADSDNNVFGRTLNPNNLSLTAGGSTGGEGSLIAQRGSVAGIGTDIAGSIRIPSACNGIYGFKPSSGIVPFAGQRGPVTEGVSGVEPVAGPMATSIRACNFLMETIMRAKPWLYDSGCHHIPWVASVPATKLKIGVVYTDGMYTPHPPVRRTIAESVRKLKDAGVEVVPIQLPSVLEAFFTTVQFYSADENKYIQKLIKSTDEPFVPSVVKKDLPNTPPMDLQKFFQLTATRHKIEQLYHELWFKHGLHAILTPPAPHTAVHFDEWLAISYTCLWNLLDYPACIIPTGRVRSSDSKDDISQAKYGEMDQQTYRLYTGPEQFTDAPTSVQLVGMKQEDERLLQ
ncbi:amidase-like protein 13 [Elsinoe australis]|uniref:Amidase-like protein 13 n=1 Tax=Elsinoe australis TaxID=40998 RepID=A0A4U7AU95_9PEZI|nr:amidase-like protein 13 [Elsinoe australis]